MKKIWLLLAGVALFSCASDDAPEAPLTTEGTILRKATATGPGFYYEAKYYYDGTKLTKSVGTSSGGDGDYTNEYTYNGDLIVKRGFDNGSESYEYDSSQRLAKVTYINSNGIGMKSVLTYNADSSVDATVYDIAPGVLTLKHTQTLYFQDGNLIRNTLHPTPNSGVGERSYIFTYDSHPNPKLYPTGTDKLTYEWWDAPNDGSHNNIVKMMYATDNTPEPIEMYHEFRTYNSYGYPVTEQVFKPDGTLQSTVSYYYQ